MVFIPTQVSVIWIPVNVTHHVVVFNDHVLVMSGAVLSIHVTTAVSDHVFP